MKKGFTLSEVLITLGIIGVVAAITLPILTKNYQKMVLRTQFKKSYNILSQAIQKSYADLEYLSSCTYTSGLGIDPVYNGCDDFHKQLLKNLNIVKTCRQNAEENGCIKDIKSNDVYSASKLNNSYTVVLNDGTIVQFWSRNLASAPIYVVDVNGLKGPDKWGYDVFSFYIYNNKLVCYNADKLVEDGGIKCHDMFTVK